MIQEKRVVLIDILTRCRDLVKTSEGSFWSCMEPHELDNTLSKTLYELKCGGKIRARELTFLFLPTGPLQEIAIDNGWGDEFLSLSARFDKVTSE